MAITASSVSPSIEIDQSEPPLRLAVIAQAISHFEVPLFRLCAGLPGLEVKVFYILPVETKRFDSGYSGVIDWGVDLLDGYDSLQVSDTAGLERAALEWHADVRLFYGYGWPGAPRLIIRNWWHRQPQVHRGTLNYFLDPRRPIKGRIMRPLGRLLLRLFDAHHYGGDYSRKVLIDAGAREDSLFFVPYSVDTPYFSVTADSHDAQSEAAALRRRLGWDQGQERVLLFIAQHNWFKGPDIAMETFRVVAASDPSVRFLVVGSGPMSDEMRSYAARYVAPERIHFAGFVSSMQTVPYYLASDLVICPSRYETWARMVNEAMLCRRPCLVSQVVPAAGGLIRDGVSGHVVERPEADVFAQAVASHFGMSEADRRQMGEQAREDAMGFAYEPHVSNVLAAAGFALAHPRRKLRRD